MQMSNLIEGLNILQKYFKNKNGYHIGAEHDILYVYQTNSQIEPSDLDKLVELGWFQPDAEYEDSFNKDNYDPNEGWAAYT